MKIHKKNSAGESGVTVSLNPFCYGVGSSFFLPIGSWFPSCPLLSLDCSDVTQITRRKDPTGKNVSILVKQAARLQTNSVSGLHRENLQDL